MKECTTHHHACDCREAEFAKLTAEIEKLKRIVEVYDKSNNKYADKDNWTGFEPLNKEGSNQVLATSRCIMRKDNDYDGPHEFSFTCGRTARQAKAEVERIRGEGR